ncbi:carbon-nitrogen hydrolase [Candidatus Micrarchaeota archaeon]|nr:carbon-nitrogen hydrolase [Candidatus Micrarchaeota archaeon]
MKTNVAVIQFAASWDAEKNVEKAVHLVEQAAQKKAHVVCLQELYRSPYFPQRGDEAFFDYAEPLQGPTFKALSPMAKKHKLYLVAPLFEKRAPGVYFNSAIVLDPRGKMAGHYRKMHVPQDAHSFSEKYYFAEGDKGYCVVDTPHGKLGILICWDQWYPEAARITSLKGADILFYPTAIGWHKNEAKQNRPDQLNAWKTMHQSHAIANNVFVAAANRVGNEDDLTFWGHSLVAAPSGRILAEASLEKEEVLVAECDLDAISVQRHGWPFLRDRRIDSYGDLLHRFLV